MKYSIPRKDTIIEDGHVLPAVSLNLTTVINFQPVGRGRAAINGDFILIAPEVQEVIRAMRAGNITIVELHNHGLTEEPACSTCITGPSTTRSPWRGRCARRWMPPTCSRHNPDATA